MENRAEKCCRFDCIYTYEEETGEHCKNCVSNKMQTGEHINRHFAYKSKYGDVDGNKDD